MDEKKQLDQEEIERLVSASQNGEADAFGTLYDIFMQPLYRYVYYRVSADDAEDLTELVFLKTWENIHQYRPGQSSFGSWIFRIAHNVVVDHYRSSRPSDELSEHLPDHSRDADSTNRIHGRLNQEAVSESMKELSDQHRQIIILKYFNDFTNEEISYITGKSQAAVRIIQFRALKRLKYLLQERGYSEENL